MGRIPLFQRAVHASVTFDGRPAMMAGAEIEETRTPIAWRLKGTGLKGASRMLPHPWPLTHCSAFPRNPVVPSRSRSHHLAHCRVTSYLARQARRRLRRGSSPSTSEAEQ